MIAIILLDMSGKMEMCGSAVSVEKFGDMSDLTGGNTNEDATESRLGTMRRN